MIAKVELLIRLPLYLLHWADWICYFLDNPYYVLLHNLLSYCPHLGTLAFNPLDFYRSLDWSGYMLSCYYLQFFELLNFVLIFCSFLITFFWHNLVQLFPISYFISLSITVSFFRVQPAFWPFITLFWSDQNLHNLSETVTMLKITKKIQST